MIWYSINDFDLSATTVYDQQWYNQQWFDIASMTLIYQQWLHIYSWIWVCFNRSEYVSIDLNMFHLIWVCFIRSEYVSLGLSMFQWIWYVSMNLICKILMICMFKAHYTMLVTIDSINEKRVALMRDFCSMTNFDLDCDRVTRTLDECLQERM